MSQIFDRKKRYVKILTKDLVHFNFQYKEGLNIDTVPFNPTGSCQPGGLYFTTMENVFNYLYYGTKIADVEIPDDAKVYDEGDKWKADKIIIKNIRNLVEWKDGKYGRHIMYECATWFVGNMQIKSEVFKQILIEKYNDARLKYIKFVKHVRKNGTSRMLQTTLEIYRYYMRELLNYIQLQN
jgi:hypothetical protein